MFKIHTSLPAEFSLIPFKDMCALERSKSSTAVACRGGKASFIESELWQALCQGLGVDEWERRSLSPQGSVVAGIDDPRSELAFDSMRNADCSIGPLFTHNVH